MGIHSGKNTGIFLGSEESWNVGSDPFGRATKWLMDFALSAWCWQMRYAERERENWHQTSQEAYFWRRHGDSHLLSP